METLEKITRAFDLLVSAKSDIEEKYKQSNPMWSKLDTMCGKLDNYIVDYASKLERFDENE